MMTQLVSLALAGTAPVNFFLLILPQRASIFLHNFGAYKLSDRSLVSGSLQQRSGRHQIKMSDQEEPQSEPALPATTGTIKYGEATAVTAEAKAAGIARGNIQVQDADAETLQLPEESSHAKELQEQAIQEMELRRRMRAAIVPTNIEAVKRVLRSLGEPVTLFGERPDERRERLRRMLADKTEDEQEAILAPEVDVEDFEYLPKQTEKFFTEGGMELRHARMQIAVFSLNRAQQRLQSAKRKRENADEDEDAEHADAIKEVQKLVNQASEIGDQRPLTCCEFTADGSRLVTASVSGTVKLWEKPGLLGFSKALSIKAHDARVTGVAWHPEAGLAGPGPSSVALGTGAADCCACLWSSEGKLLQRLTGHEQRLGRVAFHPMGSHFGTTSFDGTWRLWDVSSGITILEQEGHSRAVYALAFHPDGSLAASGGLDSYGRVWDMRTGRSIIVLEGHVRGILATAFSPNGYQMATGSEDNTARIWDLRKRACLYTLPAHHSTVSMVRFEPAEGHYLVTSSFDRTAKVWNMRDFRLARKLAGHEGHVACTDVSPDGTHLIATVSQDRTIKLWAPDEFVEDEDKVEG